MDLYTTVTTALPHIDALAEAPLAQHTSFRVGGPAEVFLQPKTEKELAEILRLCRDLAIRPVILGAGTNVVAPDEGLRGVVVCTKDCLAGLRKISETEIEADCGVSLARLAIYARDRALTGLEFAHGIPGTVGGGMVMNAGAYGGEMKDVAVKTTVMLPDGTTRDYCGAEQQLSYRRSVFMDTDCVVLRTVFRLTPGDPEAITATMRELAQKRRASQPLEYPSAGSFFKRPTGFYAGALIQQANLKGFAVGGAQISEKHAGFVVNTGGATCADIRALMAEVQRRVFDTGGVQLQPEVRFL